MPGESTGDWWPNVQPTPCWQNCPYRYGYYYPVYLPAPPENKEKLLMEFMLWLHKLGILVDKPGYIETIQEFLKGK